MMSGDKFVQVCVGGVAYSIAVSDIEKFPGTFFECMIKKEWLGEDEQKAVIIHRDGLLFKFVNAFLVNGHLPRNEHGDIDLSKETVEGLKQEADFFGLEALSKECDKVYKKRLTPDMPSYMIIRKYLEVVQRWFGGQESLLIDYSSPLIASIQAVWSPFVVRGVVPSGTTSDSIFKGTALQHVNVEELIAASVQSPFVRGMESVFEEKVRNLFEIPASRCNLPALVAIAKVCNVSRLARHQKLSFRPYKLVIYQEGGHIDAHRDSVRGHGHFGTLVVILNSDYTGGELEVTHCGSSETVTGAYSWVAMYGDCVHQIHPVTSGTRVSLIFDIYGTPYNLPSAHRDIAIRMNGDDSDSDDFNVQEVFWKTTEYAKGIAAFPLELIHRVSAEQKLAIYQCVESELQHFDSLILTLAHLYPECQSNPAFLKGGDRALYELLSEQYDVCVVAATVLHTVGYMDFDPARQTSFQLFSATRVKEAIAADKQAHKPLFLDTMHTPPQEQERTKLLISTQMRREGILDYTPFAEEVGNEPQEEKTVYLVAGLQLRHRTAKRVRSV